jgi:aspartyl/asparaginyl beta-hydroxylase (cupin superfamily)
MAEGAISVLQAAAAARQRGDEVAARRLLDEALAAAPNDPQLLNARGMAALTASQFAEARDYFARAVAADPSAPALFANLATACRGAGDDAGERAALQSVLELDRVHLVANLRLAELHERLGEKGDALQHWTAVHGIAAAFPERTPQLDELVALAAGHIERHSTALGDILDSGLTQAREEVPAEDRRRFDACVDVALGRRRIFHNECAGLHYPFLPADEFFDRRHFPWMADLEAQSDVIAAEFQELWRGAKGFLPYVTLKEGTPENKWSKLDQSLDWSAYFFWRHGVRQDEACARCPETARIIDQLPICDIPGRSPSVFFSILRPHTRLPAHTGVTNVRAIVHLPLVIPSGCGFRVGGETREWRYGTAFAFDDSINHEAWNDSDEPRAILIFDVWNPHIEPEERKLLQNFFELTASTSYATAATVD